MARPKKKSLGYCQERDLKVDEDQMCDLFDRKTKRSKMCCKNCKKFIPIPTNSITQVQE